MSFFPSTASFPTGTHFPSSATFPATALFPVGPSGVLNLTNVQKLSLDPATSVGTQVRVSDGFYVSGLTGDGAIGNGFYAFGGISGGEPWYSNVAHPSTSPGGNGVAVNYVGGLWYIDDEDVSSGLGQLSNSSGDADFPWEIGWADTAYGVPIFTHPALQQLAAASTAQGGVFVVGGTQDGVFADQTASYGLTNGKKIFQLLGANPTDYTSFGCAWSGTRWEAFGDGDPLYYSLSDVATPDLASNWKNASDDSPASITVTSVMVGALVAGVQIPTGQYAGTYEVNGSLHGRNNYLDVLGVQPNIFFNVAPPLWQNGDVSTDVANVPFPFSTAWIDVTVTRSNPAGEANWIAV